MDLGNIRSEIDRIDSEMIRLFEERMKLACSVAEYKKANSLPVYDSGRERQVVNQLAEKIDPELERYMRRFRSRGQSRYRLQKLRYPFRARRELLRRCLKYRLAHP